MDKKGEGWKTGYLEKMLSSNFIMWRCGGQTRTASFKKYFLPMQSCFFFVICSLLDLQSSLFQHTYYN